MTEPQIYPKRLIEVDLPIKKISAHARREKSIRHGHISTLHIWWARRPLAACRAVILAALWPDPADPLCPERFRKEAAARMKAFRDRRGGPTRKWDDPFEVRAALLDFIADFANWDNSNDKDYIETSRALVQVAHEALGGALGSRPLVVDPFAGGGAIPLEALRVGADAFASDLNPVAVLLNKVVLEYVPKFGQRLADEVKTWGEWVRKEAEKELAEFYPKDADGAVPVAYLWARTIRCEGPGCGAEVPLIRSLWLAKRGARSVALSLTPDRKKKTLGIDVVQGIGADGVSRGTIARGAVTCAVCGFTTPVNGVRDQLGERRGGAEDARLLCVVVQRPGTDSRSYRPPNENDLQAIERANTALKRQQAKTSPFGELPVVPDEPLPLQGTLGFRVQRYGMRTFSDLFTRRQLLNLCCLARLVREARRLASQDLESGLCEAVFTVLGLCCSKLADLLNSLCAWQPSNDRATHLFARQAIQMTWDFAESTGASGAVGNFGVAINNIARILTREANLYAEGHVEMGSAMKNPLPDDTAAAIVTDPPYYDAVPYGDLSDFFYVWLKRALPSLGQAGRDALTPKGDECIVDPSKGKDRAYFTTSMRLALAEARRVCVPNGIGVVVFAHKSTSGWEAQLAAMIDGGWVITGSWPIDTEWETRLRARNSAALASSVHLVCRPRENPDGSVRTDAIGDWRDVVAELPERIHQWMPRLVDEGVVGADAIFACLGPALEIFSRYSRVEKASGEAVSLKEYLEHVWAAVAKEALARIFAGADTAGLEEDARLTAMWLWTVSAGSVESDETAEPSKEEAEDQQDTDSKRPEAGFVLEFDAARKIAQGLGAHLEALESLVEIRGDAARLLPVAERTRFLFGGAADTSAQRKAKKRGQLKLGFLEELEQGEDTGGTGPTSAPAKGATVLDRVHQAMILFAAGRGEALKRFLVDDGVGRDDRFWKLANALSALYPAGSDEKRWGDGVLARKKGLGL